MPDRLNRERNSKKLAQYSHFVLISPHENLQQKTRNFFYRKQETSNKNHATFMSWYVGEYVRDSQTEVGAERAIIGLLEAVFGLSLGCLISSKSLSES